MEGGLELELPEPIIHHIQSFLTGKEAARTTILSKAWHNAWLTLPHIVLDEEDFTAEGNFRFSYSKSNEFLKHVKNKIDRYEQSNLKIVCLNLRMYACDNASLIVKSLLKLGATRLSFQLIGGHVVFPQEVLFGDNNLVELSVQGNCEIKLQATTEIKLETLCLKDDVHLTSDAMPVGLMMNPYVNRLRCLELFYGPLETLFPGDLLSKFPFLTDFTLHVRLEIRDSFAQVHISSRSLERVKLVLRLDEDAGNNCGASFKLDVPSIRKFTFEGSGDVIPSLSFVSCCTTREWESHVSVTHFGELTTPWFGELDKLLAELRQSKIHLSLLMESQMGFNYKVGDVESVVVRKHELENLKIDTYMPCFNCYALFDGLFRLCRPKIITLEQEKDEFFYGGWDPRPRKMTFDILCELLDQGIRLKLSDPGLFVYGSLYDLEEANGQIFDDDEQMGWWPPIPLKSLLGDQGQHRQVRFLLKWKP